MNTFLNGFDDDRGNESEYGRQDGRGKSGPLSYAPLICFCNLIARLVKISRPPENHADCNCKSVALAPWIEDDRHCDQDALDITYELLPLLFYNITNGKDRTEIRLRIASGATSSTLIFQFHEFQANGCVADVLGPVRQGIAIDDVAGVKLCFRNRAVSRVVADLAACDHVDHIRGMRMGLFLIAGFERGLEHAYTRVFQFQHDCF